MALPWLRLIDAALGLGDLARRVRRPAEQDQLAVGPSAGGALETRLAGVVVAALKEAFDRDHQRLEIEREQLAAERQRAERALRLELARQAGDREIGRLRLVAGVAVATWLATLFFSTRLAGALPARAALGVGWLLLLAALATAFVAQSRVAAALGRIDERAGAFDPAASGAAGAAAPWLLVIGLAVIGLGILI